MTNDQPDIREQPVTNEHEAKKNLERYAALVWRIHLRRSAKPIDRNSPDRYVEEAHPQ